MKKIINVCISLFVLIALLGCSSDIEEEAIDAYIEVSNNIMKMKSADYSASMYLYTDVGDVGIDVYGAYDARSNMQMNMHMNVMAFGETQEYANIYMKDNLLYFDSLEEQKTIALFDSLFIESDLKEIPIDRDLVKSLLKSAKLKDNHLILVIDKDSSYFKSFSQELDETMALSDITMDILMEDGYMTNVVLDAEITSKEEAMNAFIIVMHISLGFTNLNQDITIPFPDLTTFPEPEALDDSIDFV